MPDKQVRNGADQYAMGLKHVLLKNPRLKGWEYGMLRAFEDEIVLQTGATEVEVPDYGLHAVTKRAGHGMRWEPARKLLPKKPLHLEADVLWYVLMGPENFELDIFKDWNVNVKHRIVYIFDTLEPQFSLVQKLFTGNQFNIHITSFNDAVPYLEQLTGKKWHCVEQAVPPSMFTLVPPEEKLIDFSSYGRRFPPFHNALMEFCQSNNLYYDYTTHDGRRPTAPEKELYKQYAWHLGHSKFTVSWPVEFTNPSRAGRLHPITCRWFEAASTGTVILGKQPANDSFTEMFSEALVVELNPLDDKLLMWKKLDNIYSNRLDLQQKAINLWKARHESWTWKSRVQRILEIVNES